MANKFLRKVPGWNLFEYALLRAFAALLNLLPIEVSTQLASGIGNLLYHLLSKRRKIALENINRAFGNSISSEEKQKIAKEAFQSLSAALMEFFRIPVLLKEAERRFEFEGTEHLDQAFARGRGVVFAISHIGSWECLGFLPYVKKYPCSVIVRPIKNPHIYRWIQSLRQKTGLNPIDKTKSAKEILRRLKNNELVAILIDQWAGKDGLWMNFFSEPTSTTPVPARLAMRMGAAVIPGYCYRVSPGHFKIVIRPEVKLPESGDAETEMTRTINSLFEEEIRKHPGQWTWGHKRWKGREKYGKEV